MNNNTPEKCTLCIHAQGIPCACRCHATHNTPDTEEKCDCKKMSCEKGCDRKHTHKVFFCEICEPVDTPPQEQRGNVTTLDTEKKNFLNEVLTSCTACKKGLTPPEVLSLKGVPYCEEHHPTPDTEWEEEFDGRMTSLSRYGGFYHGNKNGVELYDFNNIKAFVKEVLSSRDTYWKERVEEAYKSGRKSFLKDITKINHSANGKQVSYVMFDEVGTIDWDKVNEALTPITNEDNLK